MDSLQTFFPSTPEIVRYLVAIKNYAGHTAVFHIRVGNGATPQEGCRAKMENTFLAIWTANATVVGNVRDHVQSSRAA